MPTVTIGGVAYDLPDNAAGAVLSLLLQVQGQTPDMADQVQVLVDQALGTTDERIDDMQTQINNALLAVDAALTAANAAVNQGGGGTSLAALTATVATLSDTLAPLPDDVAAALEAASLASSQVASAIAAADSVRPGDFVFRVEHYGASVAYNFDNEPAITAAKRAAAAKVAASSPGEGWQGYVLGFGSGDTEGVDSFIQGRWSVYRPVIIDDHGTAVVGIVPGAMPFLVSTIAGPALIIRGKADDSLWYPDSYGEDMDGMLVAGSGQAVDMDMSKGFYLIAPKSPAEQGPRDPAQGNKYRFWETTGEFSFEIMLKRVGGSWSDGILLWAVGEYQGAEPRPHHCAIYGNQLRYSCCTADGIVREFRVAIDPTQDRQWIGMRIRPDTGHSYALVSGPTGVRQWVAVDESWSNEGWSAGGRTFCRRMPTDSFTLGGGPVRMIAFALFTGDIYNNYGSIGSAPTRASGRATHSGAIFGGNEDGMLVPGVDRIMCIRPQGVRAQYNAKPDYQRITLYYGESLDIGQRGWCMLRPNAGEPANAQIYLSNMAFGVGSDYGTAVYADSPLQTAVTHCIFVGGGAPFMSRGGSSYVWIFDTCYFYSSSDAVVHFDFCQAWLTSCYMYGFEGYGVVCIDGRYIVNRCEISSTNRGYAFGFLKSGVSAFRDCMSDTEDDAHPAECHFYVTPKHQQSDSFVLDNWLMGQGKTAIPMIYHTVGGIGANTVGGDLYETLIQVTASRLAGTTMDAIVSVDSSTATTAAVLQNLRGAAALSVHRGGGRPTVGQSYPIEPTPPPNPGINLRTLSGLEPIVDINPTLDLASLTNGAEIADGQLTNRGPSGDTIVRAGGASGLTVRKDWWKTGTHGFHCNKGIYLQANGNADQRTNLTDCVVALVSDHGENCYTFRGDYAAGNTPQIAGYSGLNMGGLGRQVPLARHSGARSVVVFHYRNSRTVHMWCNLIDEYALRIKSIVEHPGGLLTLWCRFWQYGDFGNVSGATFGRLLFWAGAPTSNQIRDIQLQLAYDHSVAM